MMKLECQTNRVTRMIFEITEIELMSTFSETLFRDLTNLTVIRNSFNKYINI